MTAVLKKKTVRRSSTRSQSTSVFVLTEAIYSISPILFILLFVRVCCKLQPADQTERNSVTAFELEYNDPFVLHTHCVCQGLVCPIEILFAQVSQYVYILMRINDGYDIQ